MGGVLVVHAWSLTPTKKSLGNYLGTASPGPTLFGLLTLALALLFHHPFTIRSVCTQYPFSGSFGSPASMQPLLSPPASTASPASSHGSITNSTGLLPIPRQHPLRPGSEKEISLINYLDSKMLRIYRRYGKKFSSSEADKDDTPGYTDMEQVIADMDPLLDVVWISGTPHLQISYLLSLAGTLLSYLPAFEFSPSIFRLLSKLDLAFVTLLQPTSGSAIRSPSTSNLLSTTDKVRIKSLVEETRVAAVNCASSAGYAASVQDISSDESETEDDQEQTASRPNQDGESIAMSLSKIYKTTLEILGDSLT